MVAGINKKYLEWIGSVVRIVRGRVVKIFQSKSEGKMGRSKWRWSEDVEWGLQEMEVKRWRQKAMYREEWMSVIKQAKGSQRSVGPRSKSVNYTLSVISFVS